MSLHPRFYLLPWRCSYSRIGASLGGDDKLKVADEIAIPAWLDGGDGDDTPGVGRQRRDPRRPRRRPPGRRLRATCSSADQRDRLVGDAGDDILVVGTTAYDRNDLAAGGHHGRGAIRPLLRPARGELAGPAPALSANGLIFLTATGPAVTVFDDHVADVLTGGGGFDWFVANVDGDGDASCKDKIICRPPSSSLTSTTS
ncbi:MAG: hypothetical protein U0835_26965 [Isosphaeraceae bacterium]